MRLTAKESTDLVIGQNSILDQAIGEGSRIFGIRAADHLRTDFDKLLLRENPRATDDREKVGGYGVDRLRFVGSRHVAAPSKTSIEADSQILDAKKSGRKTQGLFDSGSAYNTLLPGFTLKVSESAFFAMIDPVIETSGF
jgi:hypothetical protein